MRLLLVAALLAGSAASARAEDRGPVRVALVCEDTGRTKACPAFVQGFVDANKVLLVSPRAGADVTLFVTATEVALVDQVHLRFVGAMAGAPPVVELDVPVDTRATDDVQRAQLEPAFLRGISLFVAARYPAAVEVKLSAPDTTAVAAPKTSAWGFQTDISGNGNYTQNYRSASGNLATSLKYIRRDVRFLVATFWNGGIDRRPPLQLDDGTLVPLNSHQWDISGGFEAIKLLDPCWSIGFGTYTNFDDPKAQYRWINHARAAIAYDKFKSDDPRGNRLEVFYHLGWETERYNLRNEIGEKFATFPIHGIDAVGEVRHDHITFGLELETNVQLNHPTRRYSVSASPYITMQLGNHVDLQLALSVTQREFPVPDPAEIDPSDYQQLARLSFAEPLSLNGSLGLSFHWDPTNGARNNRILSI